ncbi:hypothetical protein KCG55_08825 [Neisseria subflava]|uniref:DUF2846 domain-containing protein n=1 Tax=Neisseria subflava TaxID=28449 RepID=UPI0020B6D088|nr:DUF2846 domain-containing protein [Neisseria subflava]UTG73593.1 hypothetical protein KCG55_08825 [Neisseria subflava]
MLKTILSTTSILIITACSTTPITVSNGSIVPEHLIYEKNIVKQNDDPSKGNITILRDAGFTGAACSYDITLNNKKIFSIQQNQYLTIALEPGEYFLGASTGGGLCPNTQLTQDVNLKAGENREYRISISSNFQHMFTRQK